MMAYRQNDMEGAFRHFLPLAETGNADAMNMAANMFERGKGTHRDPGARSVLVEESGGAWKCGCTLPITDSIWSLHFDGKEQKLRCREFRLLRRSSGNNRAGESLVEFAPKITMPESKYTGQQQITATGLLTLRQIHIFAHSMCRKKGYALNISSRQYRIGNNYSISGKRIFGNRSSITS